MTVAEAITDSFFIIGLYLWEPDFLVIRLARVGLVWAEVRNSKFDFKLIFSYHWISNRLAESNKSPLVRRTFPTETHERHTVCLKLRLSTVCLEACSKVFRLTAHHGERSADRSWHLALWCFWFPKYNILKNTKICKLNDFSSCLRVGTWVFWIELLKFELDWSRVCGSSKSLGLTD